MTKARVVGIHYTLTDETGAVIDSSRGGEPLVYLEGAGNIIPGLERALLLLDVGATRQVKVPAAEAYGEKRNEMIIEVPKSQFPTDIQLKVGDRFRGGPDHHSPLFTVIAIGEKVTLDGNHPLAGKDLSFDVEITSIRSATDEEMSHGHVHGEGGHHH